MKRTVLTGLLAAILTIALGGIAGAAWLAVSHAGGATRTRAATITAGNQPSASVTTNDVTVSWSATTLPDATPVAGYNVEVFDNITGASRAIGGTCTGLVAALTCEDTDAGDGTWEYSVTPRQHAWAGAASPRSDPANVEDSDPAPVALTLVNGGGVPGQGFIDPTDDSLTIRYSEQLELDTICSTWTDNAVDHALSGADVVVTVHDNSGDNTITVVADDCVLHIGVLTLGDDYVVGAGASFATFDGTGANSSRVEWDAQTATLTIRLGALTAGSISATAASPSTATYAPDPTITDLAANPIDPATFTSPSQRF